MLSGLTPTPQPSSAVEGDRRVQVPAVDVGGRERRRSRPGRRPRCHARRPRGSGSGPTMRVPVGGGAGAAQQVAHLGAVVDRLAGGLQVGLHGDDRVDDDRAGAGGAAERARVAAVQVRGGGAAEQVAVAARGRDVLAPALQVDAGAVGREVQRGVGGGAAGAADDRARVADRRSKRPSIGAESRSSPPLPPVSMTMTPSALRTLMASKFDWIHSIGTYGCRRRADRLLLDQHDVAGLEELADVGQRGGGVVGRAAGAARGSARCRAWSRPARRR